MFSKHAKNECIAIAVIGLMLTITMAVLWWPAAVVVALAALAVLSFFRDPERRIPTQRGAYVSPADGHISSIHEVEHFPPFGEAAVCIRVFLSVLDVHVNRCPCHAAVLSIEKKEGEHLNALNPRSAEVNASALLVLVHPTRRHHVGAVRLVAGLFARTIVCGVTQEQILQRGERIGIIKLGSTAELYVPCSLQPHIAVHKGEKVYGGATVLAQIPPAASPATVVTAGPDATP